MEQRVLLMVNPMAGRQKIRNELLYVVDTLTKAGYETIIYTTQGKDATRDLLAEKDSQFDRVICCGGDGTFNEILSATMHWDKRPILGYIPAGTTNDFAAGLKLPSDIREAAVNIVRGTPHTVDAGLFNTSYFSYVASFFLQFFYAFLFSYQEQKIRLSSCLYPFSHQNPGSYLLA